MERKRIIYFGLLLIVAVMVIVTSFSYAFLIKTEEHHGKLNMVVGTLDYKLSSKLLNDNNQIVLNSNEKAKLNIKIESLNTTDSKYELFYTTTNNNVEIGYTTLGDQPTGTIGANSSKSVNVVIKNESNSSATITFGIIGGFTGNTLVKETGTTLPQYTGNYCEVAANTVYNFDYTGNSQEFDPPCSGNYKVELWGASGGDAKYVTQYYGGSAAYTKGNIDLDCGNSIYAYIGGRGVSHSGTSTDSPTIYGNGYNGGGAGVFFSNNSNGGGGGGATDIRLVNGTWNTFDSLKSRIMVAAGGGGADSHSAAPSWSGNGGAAGGLNGYDADKKGSYYNYGAGATQIAGGLSVPAEGFSDFSEAAGSFGLGGNVTNTHANGGSGYYGGGGSVHTSAGGGSSFISGYSGCNAISSSSTSSNITHTGQPNHYSGHVFTNAVMIDGAGCNWSTGTAANCGANQPQPDGTNATGHIGNGYARITYLSESNKEEKVPISYIVTFNANGGTVGVPNKIVTKNSTYGTLPTPTRSGYTFKGWNGKNTIKELNSTNYSLGHYSGRTSHEFKTENGVDYVRINGYQSDTTVDTLWMLNMNDKFSLTNGKSYTLSFMVRSQNATTEQYICRPVSNTTGKTGIYQNDNSISNIKYYFNEDTPFTNDGEWHQITLSFTNTLDLPVAVLTIGNDIPNLCGIGSYFDISRIQLEEGNEATTYEPYYITSSTNVVQNKNHTLTAIWEAN